MTTHTPTITTDRFGHRITCACGWSAWDEADEPVYVYEAHARHKRRETIRRLVSEAAA